MDAILGQINNNNFAQKQPQLRAVGTVKRTADFNFHRAAYALCLSLPKADPARTSTADATITYLTQFDNPKSGIQAGIRVLLGKLLVAKGDYTAAAKMLDSVATGGAGQLNPAPTPAEQNDARYFAAVARLYAGQFADVATAIKDLDVWQQTTYLPKLPAGQQAQVRAADAMLNFRLASAQADAANTPDAKQKFNDQAVTILSDLLQKQDDPTLRDLVFDQLATRLPEKPDLAKLNPLALQALQQQAFDEYNKKADQKVDEAKLRRGLAACGELAGRAGQPGVTPEMAVTALYFVAYAQEQKLHDDPAAASAFMDVMQRFPDVTDKATDAMQHAGAIVFKLHREAVARQQPDPAEVALYDRFLPLAVNPPFNQKQIAIDYANLLRSQGKFDEALTYYAAVPPADARYTSARFFTLLTLYGKLGEGKMPDGDRKQLADRLQQVAGEVAKSAAADAAAKSDADKQAALGQVAVARYDAAISARRDLKDPAKSLQWLDGFEAAIAGLNNADAYKQPVQVQRVNAYMEQGKTAEATGIVVALTKVNPEAGQSLIFDLIAQINQDLVAAKGKGDVPAERQLAANKAKLTGFLVDYAQASKDPAVQKQLPINRLYDADSKRQAAELTDDAADRKALLTAALAQYQAVKAAPGDVDAAAINLGIGLTQFDLGQYKATVASLTPVMTKVGKPFIDVNGTRTANGQYWETYYKQMRAIAEVAKAEPGNAAAQADLKAVKGKLGGFFVLYKDQVGGASYHDEFVALAKDLKVPTGPPPATAPATPAAGKK